MDTCADNQLDYRRLYAHAYPAARRRAVLSLVPGLGQLKNGEVAKGLLFLGVTVSQVVLLAVLVAGQKLAPALTAAAHTLKRQPNWSLGMPFHHGLLHSPAFAIYACLVTAFVAYAVRDAYDRALEIVRDGKPVPRARLTLPEATSGSYLFHFALIAAFIIAIIVFITPIEQQPQITQIQLVSEHKQAAKSSPAPKHQAPKRVERQRPLVRPKPVVVPPKPVVVHPVKVEKPKPTPVAVAVPTKEPTPIQAAPVEAPAPPAAAPAAPAASTEGSGMGAGKAGTGSGSGEGEAEVDMGPYMRDLQRRIKAHWFPPKGNENKRIKVAFKIFKDGHITRLKLISSSGVEMADDAALQAVQQAAPFAVLPAGVGDDVDINFTFDYHVFGAGGGRAY